MNNIIGIAGSLRKNSFNRALLATASKLAPQNLTISIATIDKIPLYNNDVEDTSGIPEPVSIINEALANAD